MCGAPPGNIFSIKPIASIVSALGAALPHSQHCQQAVQPGLTLVEHLTTLHMLKQHNPSFNGPHPPLVVVPCTCLATHCAMQRTCGTTPADATCLGQPHWQGGSVICGLSCNTCLPPLRCFANTCCKHVGSPQMCNQWYCECNHNTCCCCWTGCTTTPRSALLANRLPVDRSQPAVPTSSTPDTTGICHCHQSWHIGCATENTQNHTLTAQCTHSPLPCSTAPPAWSGCGPDQWGRRQPLA
jgi:hypothetical protein